jgi:hypothetical protein
MRVCVNVTQKVEPEMSLALGNGLKCGFLGLLHMEVFHQRLQDEFDIPVLLTTPQVKKKYIYIIFLYSIARSCVSEHHICIFIIIIIIIYSKYLKKTKVCKKYNK